jgi:uncharacterized membrane protein YhaH (DUF805 family)
VIFSNPELGLFSPLVSLGLLLPDIVVSALQLHDFGRTEWWLLVNLTVIGIILLLILGLHKRHYRPQPL